LNTEGVSIHAFRGEGDADILAFAKRTWVSIHAFRGEGDGVRVGY